MWRKEERGERVGEDGDDDERFAYEAVMIAFRAGAGSQSSASRKTDALCCKNRVRSCSPKEEESDRGPLTLSKKNREKERG